LGDIETIEKRIHDLCYVLSVGIGSKVQWIFYRVFSKGLLIYARHIRVPTKSFNSQSIIDAEKDKQNWADFINVAYPCYLTAISRFGEISGIPRITAAIDVFMDARSPADFTKTRGIKLAGTMEIIKEIFKVAWVPETKLLRCQKSKNMEHEIKEALEPILKRYLSDEDTKNVLEKSYQLNKVSFETILKNRIRKNQIYAESRRFETFRNEQG
jgi:hypothetical protein